MKISARQKKEIKTEPRDKLYTALTVALAATLALVVAYIIYVNFARYWDLLHYDLATDLAFIREAAAQGTLFPKGWLHLREIRLVHITTVALLVFKICGNLHLSYPIACSITLIINCCLYFYMMGYKKLRALPALSGLLALLAFFAFFIPFPSSDEFSIFTILFFTNCSYAPHLSTIFLTLGVYLRVKTRGSAYRINLILYFLLALTAFAQGVQSTRLLIGLYFPIFIFEAYSVLVKLSRGQSKGLLSGGAPVFSGICFVCACLGVLTGQALFRLGIVTTYYTGTNVDLSIVKNEDLFNRIGLYIREVFSSLGLRGGSGVFSINGVIYFGRLLCVAAMIAFARVILRKRGDHYILISILSLSFLCLSAALIFTQVEVAARHIFTIVLLMSVISYAIIERVLTLKSRIFTAASCFLLIIISLLAITTMSVEKNESLISVRQAVVDFINGQGLTIGYGTVWEAEVCSAMADYSFDVIPVDYDFTRTFKRGMTASRFFHSEERVFLITKGWMADNAANDARIGKILESGDRHDFNGGWVVYLFDYNPWHETAGR